MKGIVYVVIVRLIFLGDGKAPLEIKLFVRLKLP